MAAEPFAPADPSSLARLRERRSAKWEVYADDVLPAWVAETDFELADPIRAALERAVGLGDTGYAAPAEAGLARAFAQFAAGRLGWEPDPAHVIPTGDVVGGLAELVELLTEPGEGVVINPPVYHPFSILIAERRRTVVEVPLVADPGGGADQLDPEGIERAFAAGARALILCSPHNPTGVVPSREQLEAIAEAAARHGAWVFADEIHAPLTLPGAEHVPFVGLSDAARERGIALSSASKAFNLAGLKCAVIAAVAGTAAAEAIDGLPSLARHPGHFGVLASVAAFSDPASAAWLDRAIETIAGNRELLGELLAERLPEVGYAPPQAGYLTWLDLSAYGLGADPAPGLLEHGRIALSPGPQFGTGGEGHVRLNIGTSPELVREAVERIATGVER